MENNSNNSNNTEVTQLFNWVMGIFLFVQKLYLKKVRKYPQGGAKVKNNYLLD